MLRKNNHIHFIGVGGIGMSGIAQLCLAKGYRVSGSDIASSDLINHLIEAGATIHIGHDQRHIASPDLVVYSTAIKENNPELIEARKRNIPIWRRAELLAALSQEQDLVVIAGAHGKTTTSSLVAHLLLQAHLHPSVAVGGIVQNMSQNAALGTGEYFVAEADESDGSFLHYRPAYTLITNIDYEHLDFYKTLKNIKKTFLEFVVRTKRDGCVLWCYDDRHLRSLLLNQHIEARTVSFGLSHEADIRASDIALSPTMSDFDVYRKGSKLGRFQLGVPGVHNISNALAAIGLGIELGLAIPVLQKTCKTFLGVRRRFQIKYSHRDIVVIDDYGHHPTEIRAVIKTARACRPRRLVVLFQPHRYTRLQQLFEKFVHSFRGADQLFIVDLYAAGEAKIRGVSAKKLCSAIRKSGGVRARYLATDDIVRMLPSKIRAGDMVIFLGAGNITSVCDAVVEKLKRNNSI